MSKPRYRWWGYVKNVIREYPKLCEQYQELHATSTTANYVGIPGGVELARTVETTAIRELPKASQREYEAVRLAVQMTLDSRNGPDKLKIVSLVYWKRSHTLEGAAMKTAYSYEAAKRYQREFILRVARNLGLLDKNVTTRAKNP